MSGENVEGHPRPESGPNKQQNYATPGDTTVDAVGGLISYALADGARGWPVFPCHDVFIGACSCRNSECGSPGKHPRIREWQRAASTDPDQITEWWTQWPQAPIAVVTGSRSGLVVPDIDDGEAFRSTGIKSPETLMSRTGRGAHLFYATMPEEVIEKWDAYLTPEGTLTADRSSGNKVFEIKAEGSYVIVPPSQHSSGKAYEWVNPSAEIVLRPDWVFKPEFKRVSTATFEITENTTEYGIQTLASECRKLSVAVGGARNTTLYTAAVVLGKRIAQGQVERADVESHLTATALGVGLTPTETTATIASGIGKAISGYEAELHKASSTSTYPRLRDEAYHGLVGKVVERILPHTEADPAALVFSFLSFFGAAVGHKRFAMADGAIHTPRLNTVLVGKTSSGRKGTAVSNIKRPMAVADPNFTTERIVNGLASGEGLIASVRDPQARGDDDDNESAPLAVVDKRLLVVEPEFVRVLRAGSREGSILSSIIRQAWDGQDLSVMTRHQPLRASDPHIVVLGQITQNELRNTLKAGEVLNGFGNRFLFTLTSRSKKMPEGNTLTIDVIERLGRDISAVLQSVQGGGSRELARSHNAKKLWREIYMNIDDELDGLLGALVARAAAQMLRLQVAYAVMDGTDFIEPAHVKAAKAVWDYSEASAEVIFGDGPDSDALKFVEAVRAAGEDGLDGTAQNAVFHRHRTSEQLEQIRTKAERWGLTFTMTESTGPLGGRPKIVTRSIPRGLFAQKSFFAQPPDGSSSGGTERINQIERINPQEPTAQPTDSGGGGTERINPNPANKPLDSDLPDTQPATRSEKVLSYEELQAILNDPHAPEPDEASDDDGDDPGDRALTAEELDAYAEDPDDE